MLPVPAALPSDFTGGGTQCGDVLKHINPGSGHLVQVRTVEPIAGNDQQFVGQHGAGRRPVMVIVRQLRFPKDFPVRREAGGAVRTEMEEYAIGFQ